MSTVLVVVIVIVVIVALGAVGFFARGQARRRGLQQRFGPEYDRTVESHESTREAEQELLAREKRLVRAPAGVPHAVTAMTRERRR